MCFTDWSSHFWISSSRRGSNISKSRWADSALHRTAFLRPGKALQSLQDSVDRRPRSHEPQWGWGLGRAIPALKCLWVCCLPWATHCLISKARPVAQSQLCPLPSGQPPVAQLDGGQHLQACLGRRSADQAQPTGHTAAAHFRRGRPHACLFLSPFCMTRLA